jgi:hypothetical protein
MRIVAPPTVPIPTIPMFTTRIQAILQGAIKRRLLYHIVRISMDQNVSTLSLVWRKRLGYVTSYSTRTERDYLDFVIDSQSLQDVLRQGDLIGCLGWGVPEEESHLAEVLLLKQPSGLTDDQAMLYVCPECGDLGCGAVTVRIQEDETTVLWSRFGYDNGYEEGFPDFQRFQTLGPFRFDKARYYEVIQRRSKSM